jgi:hypothetical protein
MECFWHYTFGNRIEIILPSTLKRIEQLGFNEQCLNKITIGENVELHYEKKDFTYEDYRSFDLEEDRYGNFKKKWKREEGAVFGDNNEYIEKRDTNLYTSFNHYGSYEESAFLESFQSVYVNDYGSAAGTYIFKNDTWEMM